MTENEYLAELGKLSGSRKNQIIRTVNEKGPKEQLSFHSEAEAVFFDRLMKEAETHEKKYGSWPVFALCEIEHDDPVLDVYSRPAQKRNK